MIMYSALCKKIIESPYHSGKRKGVVNKFVVHCYVGHVTIERGGAGFQHRAPGKEASCNYLIGVDGAIAGIVDENNRSWCTSSAACDNYAITVECASENVKPYTFNNEVFESAITLCVDVCRRYGKTKLVFIPEKEKAKAYKPADNEMQLTYHKFYAAKACPGHWFIDHTAEFVARVNAQLGNNAPQNSTIPPTTRTYTVQPGDNLSKIARMYGTSYIKIANAQPKKILPPYIIKPGQVLIIP